MEVAGPQEVRERSSFWTLRERLKTAVRKLDDGQQSHRHDRSFYRFASWPAEFMKRSRRVPAVGVLILVAGCVDRVGYFWTRSLSRSVATSGGTP